MDKSKNKLQSRLKTLAALALVLPLAGTSLNGLADDDENKDQDTPKGEMTLSVPDLAATDNLTLPPVLNDENTDSDTEEEVDGSGKAIETLSSKLVSLNEDDDESEEEDQGQYSIELG